MNISFYILFIFIAGSVSGKNNEEKVGSTYGPYRAILVSVSRCENTTYPLQKDPPMMMNLEAFTSGTSRYPLLRGNLTILRETRHVKIKLKSFVLHNGKYKMTYVINSMSCHGLLMDLMCKTLHFELFDTGKCAFNKGEYVLKGIDPNIIQHIWAAKTEYGRVLWRYETTVGPFTFYCWDLVTLVERPGTEASVAKS